MPKIPHILLAAGSSSRLGKPKQLLKWGNKALIVHQIEILKCTHQPIVVVLGANSSSIIPVISDLDVAIVINDNWQEGMGISLSEGTKWVVENWQDSEGVLVSLVDQPLISAIHFEKLLATFVVDNQDIILSKSKMNYKGVPALFDKFYFDKLRQLQGDEGAKEITKKHIKNVKWCETDVNFEDIDTLENYQNLLSHLL